MFGRKPFPGIHDSVEKGRDLFRLPVVRECCLEYEHRYLLFALLSGIDLVHG